MSQADATAVTARLEADRRALLDLTLRNPLLNYRPRTRAIEVVGESSAAVFRTLVRDGKAMTFRADARVTSDQPVGPLEPLKVDTTDLRLQTALSAAELEARLLAISYAARGSIEEQGVNTLYLAVGMLRWFEPDEPTRGLDAPLVLIPVALERSAARERFRLRHDGEDPGANLSLLEKLRTVARVDLPALPDDESVEISAYLDAVALTVEATGRNWTVDRDRMVLGFFSFGKFLMYRDLEASAWPDDARPDRHPIVSLLLGEGFPRSPVSEGEPPPAPLLVLDADGSQAEAIADVARGQSLVIQGPPGTGKSQTITNLIADAVGRGRSVLFVAEKMAALEVVKRRLDAVGLGAACLELHSRKASKKAVLAELKKAVESPKPRGATSGDESRLLDEQRTRLDTYVESLQAPIAASGVSPYQAIGELLALGDEAEIGSLPRPELPDLISWTGFDFERRLALVEPLRARLEGLGVPASHPFFGSLRTLILPAEFDQLRTLAREAAQALTRVSEAGNRLAGRLGLAPPRSRGEAEEWLALGRRAAKGLPLLAPGIDVRLGEWTSRSDAIRELIEAGDAVSLARQAHGANLVPEAWTRDLSATRAELNIHGRKWWSFVSPAYRRAQRKVAELCRGAPPRGLTETLALVDAVIDAARHAETVRELDPLGARLFGEAWRRERSDWRALGSLTSWIQKLQAEARAGKVPSALLDFLAQASPADAPALDEAMKALKLALDAQLDPVAKLSGFLELEPTRFGEGGFASLPFADQASRLESWQARPEALRGLASWNHEAARCRSEGLGGVVNLAESWPDAVRDLTRAFRRRWFEGLLDVAFQDRPALRGFEGPAHERAIASFRELDLRSLVQTRIQVATEHWKRLPRHEAGGQLGILRREFEKKARHLPLRQLLARAGNAVRAIKPVFLMSPLSVATYLAPGQLRFDLVVFDEASQVRPVDALGALLRGNQAVVVGDSRQLPPTNFFDRLVNDGDEDDDLEPTSGEVESILALFAAQGAPERWLRWHYRSRHESLIAVSNREFYDGRLITFPSPDAARLETGLRLRHLPETAYDRGGSRTNPREAEIVADAVLAHAREQLARPREQRVSLGVAAFSAVQARAIRDRLETLRRDEPAVEPFFALEGAEPFFVKNLENVQGDERDVIFISLGYGRTAKGDVPLNFGPLNLDGGERRLNVLITRARLRCEVFSNIRAEDLDPGRTSSRGLHALRTFLAYAEHGRFEGEEATLASAEPGSAFEGAVRDALARSGHRIRARVGSSEARVDLAVEDPDRPGRYLLAIEADGSDALAAASSRERERLRPRMLEGLGWRLHRAWSPDWYRDPAQALGRALSAIAEARQSAPPIPVEPAEVVPPTEDPAEEAEPTAEPAFRVPAYRLAELVVDLAGRELADTTLKSRVKWVADVVDVEGPVHVSEVMRRVVDAAGVKRLGSRIQSALEQAIATAVEQARCRRAGDFLWPVDRAEPVVRDRSELPAASRALELIAPEEVALAIETVVQGAFGMEPDAIPAAAARLMGFSRATDEMKLVLEARRDELITQGRLARRGEHLVIPELRVAG